MLAATPGSARPEADNAREDALIGAEPECTILVGCRTAPAGSTGAFTTALATWLSRR